MSDIYDAEMSSPVYDPLPSLSESSDEEMKIYNRRMKRAVPSKTKTRVTTDQIHTQSGEDEQIQFEVAQKTPTVAKSSKKGGTKRVKNTSLAKFSPIKTNNNTTPNDNILNDGEYVKLLCSNQKLFGATYIANAKCDGDQ